MPPAGERATAEATCCESSSHDNGLGLHLRHPVQFRPVENAVLLWIPDMKRRELLCATLAVATGGMLSSVRRVWGDDLQCRAVYRSDSVIDLNQQCIDLCERLLADESGKLLDDSDRRLVSVCRDMCVVVHRDLSAAAALPAGRRRAAAIFQACADACDRLAQVLEQDVTGRELHGAHELYRRNAIACRDLVG